MLLLDPAGCYPGRGAVVYDTSSFAEALADAGVAEGTVVHSVSLGAPMHGHGGAAALRKLYTVPPLARRLSLGACPGVVFNLGGLRGATAIGSGGELQLRAPMLLVGLHAAPVEAPEPARAGGGGAVNDTVCASTLPRTPEPLLKAVRLARGGVLALVGVRMAAFDAAELAGQLEQEGAVRLVQAAGVSMRGGGGSAAAIVVNGSITANKGGAGAGGRARGPGEGARPLDEGRVAGRGFHGAPFARGGGALVRRPRRRPRGAAGAAPDGRRLEPAGATRAAHA
jgi:hypothetical protein